MAFVNVLRLNDILHRTSQPVIETKRSTRKNNITEKK
jgi:hypothetical protein